MSQQNVESVIDRLLTDAQLRLRFAVDRFNTVVELVLGDVELTSEEIDLFIQSDARLWFSDETRASGRRH